MTRWIPSRYRKSEIKITQLTEYNERQVVGSVALYANETPGVSELDVLNLQSETASTDLTVFYVQAESGVYIRALLAAAVDGDLLCPVIRVVVPHGRSGA